jgi:hypothetical protein
MIAAAGRLGGWYGPAVGSAQGLVSGMNGVNL